MQTSMIKYAFLLLAFAPPVMACPDFSGHYKFAEQPWNGSITIEQTGCRRMVITQTKGRSVLKQSVRLDGKAYVGVEDASKRANQDTSWFQKVSWQKDRLVLRQYSGSMRECSGQHAFNSDRCHLLEYALVHDEKANSYVWTQSGLWWTDGGRHSTQNYALSKYSGLFIARN